MAVFFIYRLFYVLPNPLNRITAATDNTRRFGLSNVKYDKNGNITHLTRGGHLKEMPDWDKDDDFGTMDQLDYQYFDGSNRLRSVTDGILKNDTSGKGEFVDGNKDGDDYVYDPNGNMTQDLNKGIKGATLAEKGIEYNHLNLPTLVRVHNGADVGTISYIYDATGVKLRKNVLKQGETTPTATDYAGNYIYENGNLQFFSQPEGYVSVENGNYEYVYEYKDHLGNTRLSYTDANNDGNITTNEIVKESNYYPFGLAHQGYNGNVSPLGNSVAKKYMFGGKELDESLGLETYDFGARNYDPALGRWMNLDPLADSYRSFTPHNFAANNPILLTDPDGRDISFSYEYEKDADGNDIINKNGTRNLTGITMTVTGKVINVSKGGDIDIDDAISEITSSIKSSFKGSVNGISFNTVVDLKEAESFDDIEESDHVFALADIDEEAMQSMGVDKYGNNIYEAAGGSNMNGGKVAFIDARYFRGWFDTSIGSTGERTATHEFGHLLNFGGHGSASGFRNLMTSGGGGFNITTKQLSTIIRNIKYDSRINKGVNYEIVIVPSPSSPGGSKSVKKPNRGKLGRKIRY